jgi:hypothetical protein
MPYLIIMVYTFSEAVNFKYVIMLLFSKHPAFIYHRTYIYTYIHSSATSVMFQAKFW